MKKYFPIAILVLFTACSTTRTPAVNTVKTPFSGTALEYAHVGICISDPTTGEIVYAHNADKYFTPASNMKLFSLYTALSVLNDQLPGMDYVETTDSIFLFPTGDPTFLHRDYKDQPVFDFLKKVHLPLAITAANWNEKHFGPGWAWSDFDAYYMPERSPFPVYGNVIHWVQQTRKNEQPISKEDSLETLVLSEPDINWKVNFLYGKKGNTFRVTRDKNNNHFFIAEGKEPQANTDVPFVTDTLRSALELLYDSLGKEINSTGTLRREIPQTIYSRPLDSVLRPMMHVSDNFFAEQLLLCCSYMKTGYFNAAAIIDSMMTGPLSAMPDKPRWVDGSGLSRYNLVTPRSMTWLLGKMQQEFGMERLKNILPTGGEGTLKNYYLNKKGMIFAKTGTLSNQVALSGYLYSSKGKLLVFSFLVNNHTSPVSEVRKEVEQFLGRF
jgi:serine-type D-Ala-D-Ala carboxypeptidase/endopeptidase (penicillin-binding protein 4)